MNKIPLILLISLFTLAGCQEKEPTETSKETTPKVVVVKATDVMAEKKVEAKAPEKQAENDEESGSALHEANCAKCHGEGYYPKKPESKMTSYDGLHKMVGMCDAQLGTELFPEELQKIGDYLNDSFYKFSN